MIKDEVKKTIRSIYATDNNDLERVLESYNYISFDVFDTLIKRNVGRPEDIFEIIEQSTNINSFKEKRINAEFRARSKSKNK